MSANADGDSRGSAVHASGEFREGSHLGSAVLSPTVSRKLASAEVCFQGASLSKNQRGAMKSALNVAINMDLALRRHTARNRQVVAEG